ncbi:hypothetical protein CFK39_01355 [Brachybacterium avium]|uniref:Uncharacterized protein n=1 Tax=Brachybacterium avium TaxID=2017485 RepID=A0A220U9F7_9MICO|nr:hypothetical protein [Brachybacterium avium]ASK64710.1 hypothetical protein CFK39_01355 [Brachybacterium avium]
MVLGSVDGAILPGRPLGLIALQGWATLGCALLAGAMIWAVATGEASWWILLLLGWAPLLGVAILAPRLLRTLRTDVTRPAELSPAGWVDHLHGQGLVAWEDIESVEVRGQHTLVTARADAPRFIDRDLGNRVNHRLERWLSRSSVQVRSAGPLFREVGPHQLPYPPSPGHSPWSARWRGRGGPTCCGIGDGPAACR